MKRFCLSELGTSRNNGSGSKLPFANFSFGGPGRCAARIPAIVGDAAAAAIVRGGGAGTATAGALLPAALVPALVVTTGCEPAAIAAGAEAVDPTAGGAAVEAEEVVSLLLMSAFEPLLLLRWIARLNLKTIPDYPTVTLV
jgi:hypothetical protein